MYQVDITLINYSVLWSFLGLQFRPSGQKFLAVRIWPYGPTSQCLERATPKRWSKYTTYNNHLWISFSPFNPAFQNWNKFVIIQPSIVILVEQAKNCLNLKWKDKKLFVEPKSNFSHFSRWSHNFSQRELQPSKVTKEWRNIPVCRGVVRQEGFPLIAAP